MKATTMTLNVGSATSGRGDRLPIPGAALPRLSANPTPIVVDTARACRLNLHLSSAEARRAMRFERFHSAAYPMPLFSHTGRSTRTCTSAAAPKRSMHVSMYGPPCAYQLGRRGAGCRHGAVVVGASRIINAAELTCHGRASA